MAGRGGRAGTGGSGPLSESLRSSLCTRYTTTIGTQAYTQMHSRTRMHIATQLHSHTKQRPSHMHKRVVFNGATSNRSIRLLLYGEFVNTQKMARMRFEPLLFYFSEHLEHVSVNSWVKTMNGLEVFIRGATSR